MSPTPQTEAVDLLRLPDAAYFTLGTDALSALKARLAETVQPPPLAVPPGVPDDPIPELRAIGMPRQIELVQSQKLPLLLAEVRTGQRAWEVEPQQNRVLLVTHLATGAVMATSARSKGRRMPVLAPSGTGTPPDDFNSRLSSIDVTLHDLLLWLPPDRLLGRLAVTILDFDLPTNTVQVETSGPPAGKGPDGAAASMAPRRRIAVENADVAEISAGVRLETHATTSTAGRPMLYGSIDLPATEVAFREHDRSPAASIVFVRLDGDAPVVVDVDLPRDPDAPPGQVRASFRLAVADALRDALVAGRWAAYLVVGHAVSRPATMIL